MKKTKAELKREQIIETAIEIVRRNGFSRITMEQVASELHLTKGSLYYYFRNKSDLLYQCHKYFLLQAIKQFESVLHEGDDVEETLKKIVDIHIEKAIQEREAFNLLISPKDYFDEEQIKSIAVLRSRYESFFVQVFEQGKADGIFQCKDLTLAKLFIFGGMNWIQQWYLPNGRLSKEEIKELFFTYIMKVLK